LESGWNIFKALNIDFSQLKGLYCKLMISMKTPSIAEVIDLRIGLISFIRSRRSSLEIVPRPK
jgi:hypothetical protein